MKKANIKKVLAVLSSELKDDSKWEKFSKKTTTCDVFGKWLKANRPELYTLVGSLNNKELWDNGFFSAAVLLGKTARA